MWDRPAPRSVLALIIAIGLVVWKGPTILTALRSGSMRTTTGVVTDAAEAGSSLRGNRQIHRVYLEYEYEVDGKAYTSDRVALFDNQFATRDIAVRYADEHPLGREVTVFYDPAAPGRSALALSGGAISPALILWGGLIVVSLGASAYFGWHALQERAGRV